MSGWNVGGRIPDAMRPDGILDGEASGEGGTSVGKIPDAICPGGMLAGEEFRIRWDVRV